MLKKGDLIVIKDTSNLSYGWPESGLIVFERFLPSRIYLKDLPDPDPAFYDILWSDGILTKGVDASWLCRYYSKS